MNKEVKYFNKPTSEQLKPIVDGFVSYGESLVGENIPVKLVSHLLLEGLLIGGVVGARQYDRYYLSHVWVHPDYRGQGMGSYLMDKTERQLSQSGCNSVVLETLSSRAVSWYKKFGYTTLSEIKNYVGEYHLVHLQKNV